MERRESVEMVVVGSPMTLRGRVAEARRERERRAGDFSGRYAPEGRVRVLVEIRAGSQDAMIRKRIEAWIKLKLTSTRSHHSD